MDAVRKKIANKIKDLGTDYKSVSIAIGRNHAYIQQFIEREIPRKLKEEDRIKLAKHLRIPETEIGGRAIEAQTHQSVDFKQASAPISYITEYDVSVSAGGGSFIENENIKGKWPFNPDYLAGYLGLNNAHLAIVEVAGDSMEPTLSTGDRVMVNMNDVSISQPGIFVVYDGYGTVIKRVERILGSEGGIRLISDNIRHKTYEVDDQTVNIVGRVIWAAKRL